MFLKIVLTVLTALAAWPAPARAADTTACDLHWQITPHLDATPRHLAVALTFDGGSRSRSTLQLPSRWAGVDDFGASITGLEVTGSGQAIEPVPGKPAERTIVHRPGERVVLQYQVLSPITDPDAMQPRPAADIFRTQLGARWFEVFGHAMLAVPVVPAERSDRAASRLCIDFDGLPEGSWWIGSHGAQRGANARFRFQGSPALALNAVYLGGDLQVRERRVDGKAVFTAMPPQALFAVGIDALAERVAVLVEAERRFWHDPGTDHQLVVLHPDQPTEASGGTAVYQALVMHAASNLPVPGDVFDAVLTHELLHAWFPDRFGPLAYQGRDNEAERHWFSEGFTDYYTHRILLNAGLWTLGDHARALNAKLDRYRRSPALRADNAKVAAQFYADPVLAELTAARGEWLALRWHAALRAKGHPGLDTVMRQLLLPANQAQRQGPMSKPLVTHRLLAALRPTLGETPLHDLTRLIEQGQPFEFNDTTLGPCFKLISPTTGEAPRYQPASDGLQQPGCRSWMAIGGDTVDASSTAAAAPAAAPAVATSQVCKKVKGKKAKVCKTVAVKGGKARFGTAAPHGGKSSKGKIKAATSQAKGKANLGSGKKAKPKPVKRNTAR